MVFISSIYFSGWLLHGWPANRWWRVVWRCDICPWYPWRWMSSLHGRILTCGFWIDNFDNGVELTEGWHWIFNGFISSNYNLCLERMISYTIYIRILLIKRAWNWSYGGHKHFPELSYNFIFTFNLVMDFSRSMLWFDQLMEVYSPSLVLLLSLPTAFSPHPTKILALDFLELKIKIRQHFHNQAESAIPQCCVDRADHERMDTYGNSYNIHFHSIYKVAFYRWREAWQEVEDLLGSDQPFSLSPIIHERSGN